MTGGATLSQLLSQAADRLAEAAIEEPRREARLLLCHATGLDGAALLRHAQSDYPAPGFQALVSRRAAREPLAFITGHQPFWTLDLLVSPDTLIPRADSETLIEAALEAFPRREVRHVLDLGTGTGCLLLAALTEFANAWGVGVDRVAGAAWLARRNARRLGLDGRAAVLCADWAAPLDARFDLVLSNPPYIESATISGLMPDVALFEPRSALDGGTDGLAAYHAILAALPDVLAEDGLAILELGEGQAEAVGALARDAGLRPEPARRDLGGIERALPIRPGKKSFGGSRRPR